MNEAAITPAGEESGKEAKFKAVEEYANKEYEGRINL